ncbi:MAG TPA: DUF5678 domain-containing protein [Nevskiaceae bacterium]|nr:DUF5678 domain-containing protein [Nevskiaceae bacterium]
MTAKNWTQLYKKYKGQWVALKDDEVTVISAGPKLPVVIQQAEDKGYPKPILAKVPEQDITYIG